MIAASFEGPFALEAADLDADGDLDVAVAAFYGGPGLGQNGRYAWFENLAADGSAWTEHLIAAGYWGAESLSVADLDLDGDGDLDLAGASSLANVGNSAPDVAWFENLDGGAGAWLAHAVDSELDGAISVRAADLDGDQDLDLAVAAYGDSIVTWYENVGGAAASWLRHDVIVQFSTATSVDAGDLDEDGDVDLVATEINVNSIVWFENLTGTGSAWGLHFVESAFVRSDECAPGRLRRGRGPGRARQQQPAALLRRRRVVGERRRRGRRLLGPFTRLLRPEHLVDRDRGIDDDGKLDALASYDTDGDVVAFEPTQLVATGELHGTWLIKQPYERWDTIGWSASVPAGAQLAVEARFASDPRNPGPWQRLPVSGSAPSPTDATRPLFQYRLLLTASGPDAAPVVRSVSVDKLPHQRPAPIPISVVPKTKNLEL